MLGRVVQSTQTDISLCTPDNLSCAPSAFNQNAMMQQYLTSTAAKNDDETEAIIAGPFTDADKHQCSYREQVFPRSYDNSTMQMRSSQPEKKSQQQQAIKTDALWKPIIRKFRQFIKIKVMH